MEVFCRLGGGVQGLLSARKLMAKGKQNMSALVIRMGLILPTAIQGEGREGGLGAQHERADSHLLGPQGAGG